jgi:hypothetical protein
MGHRLLASILAFMLLWSAVGTVEGMTGFMQTLPEHHTAFVSGGGTNDGQDGSVEDHHLDDLPGQPASDSPLDSPGLPDAGPALRLRSEVLASREAIAAVLLAPPYLAGPLRPPCGGADQA